MIHSIKNFVDWRAYGKRVALFNLIYLIAVEVFVVTSLIQHL